MWQYKQILTKYSARKRCEIYITKFQMTIQFICTDLRLISDTALRLQQPSPGGRSRSCKLATCATFNLSRCTQQNATLSPHDLTYSSKIKRNSRQTQIRYYDTWRGEGLVYRDWNLIWTSSTLNWTQQKFSKRRHISTKPHGVIYKNTSKC
jgi:hypothetical protein